jgi:predicted PurR-regulated permease PerM
MERSAAFPFFVKCSLILLGFMGFIYSLYLCRSILVPLVFSAIISILLDPVVIFLVRHRFPRLLAIILTLTVAIALLAALMFFISSQVSSFAESLPELQKKIGTWTGMGLIWISETFNIDQDRIIGWFTKAKTEALKSGTGMIGHTLGSIGGALASGILIPVYIFLFLFYKKLLLQFVSRLFKGDGKNKMVDVLHQIKSIIKSYLVGLLFEAGIICTLYSVGLSIIGVKYAILLGILAALFNMIPYIGILFAMIPTIIIAAATGTGTTVLLAIGLFGFIQLIDNNFIIPRIVASKVKINALMAIIALLAGGALWGIPGMFMSLPLTAIVKIICDHVEQLRPIGLLLGEEIPGKRRRRIRFRKRKIPAPKEA